MTSDPWDGLPSGNFVKWEEVGEEIVGDVIGKGVGEDFNGHDCPQLVIRNDDAEEVTLTAGQAQLKAKLLEANPNVGDRIKVKYTGTEKADKGDKKLFEVTVKRGGAKAPVAQEEVSSAADDDF
jgi:hypothetical protein